MLWLFVSAIFADTYIAKKIEVFLLKKWYGPNFEILSAFLSQKRQFCLPTYLWQKSLTIITSVPMYRHIWLAFQLLASFAEFLRRFSCCVPSRGLRNLFDTSIWTNYEIHFCRVFAKLSFLSIRARCYKAYIQTRFFFLLELNLWMSRHLSCDP
jgi:hypothetical protein